MKIFLESIDIMSQNFRFTYKGKDKYRTVLGGILSLFAFLVIMINGWLIGKDIYFKEKPVAVSYEEVLPFYPTTRLSYNNIFFAFYLSDYLDNVYEDESILKIIPLMYTGYSDGKGKLKYRERFLELTDCPSEFKRLNLTVPLEERNFKTLKCIKNFDELISGFFTEGHSWYLMFKITKCNNSTYYEKSNLENEQEEKAFEEFESKIGNKNIMKLENSKNKNHESNQYLNFASYSLKHNSNNKSKIGENNTICKPAEILDEVIPTLYFNFLYSTIVINAKNYSSPMVQQISIDWFVLSTKTLKSIDYFFQYTVMRTDEGLIFSQDYHDEIKVGYKNHLTNDGTITQSQPDLFQVGIYVSNKVRYMTREYIKVQNIFANLGGIIKIVLLVIKILSSPFFQKKLNLKMINELYHYHDMESEKIDEKNNLKKLDIKNIDSLINFKNKRQGIFKKNKFERSGNQTYFNCKETFKSTKNPISINNIEMQGLRNKFEVKSNERLINHKNLQTNLKSNKISDNGCLNESNRTMNKKIFYDFNLDITSYKNEYLDLEQNKNRCIEQNQKKIEFDLDKKIEEVFDPRGRKLRYKDSEVFRSLYCNFICKSQIVKDKDLFYNHALENLNLFTDYLENIKNFQNLTKMKYLLFSTEQISSFPYLSNPKKVKGGYYHEIEEYSKAYEAQTIKKEKGIELFHYFLKRIDEKNLDNYDKKIWNILDPRMKNLFVQKFQE